MSRMGNFRELSNKEINNVSGGQGLPYCAPQDPDVNRALREAIVNYLQGQGFNTDEEVVNAIAHEGNDLRDGENGLSMKFAENGRAYFFEDTDGNGLYDEISYFDGDSQFVSTDGETWKKYLIDNGFVEPNNFEGF